MKTETTLRDQCESELAERRKQRAEEILLRLRGLRRGPLPRALRKTRWGARGHCETTSLDRGENEGR